MVIEFFSCSGDRDPISGRVILKIPKMVLDASLLNTQYFKVQIKGKWSNTLKEVAPSLTRRFSSDKKETP